MIGIYIIKNVKNNKVYVGSTNKSLLLRKKQHFNNLKNNKHENPYLQNSWNKHGENNFLFIVILEQEKINIDELLKLESNIIKKYKALDRKFGYNICEVGKSRLGTKWSEESKSKRIGKGNPMFGKGYLVSGELNSNFGKEISLETRIKIGLKSKGHKNNSQALYKPVIQYTLDGKPINEYKSGVEAFKITKIKHISSVCNGKRKTAGGFKWSFK